MRGVDVKIEFDGRPLQQAIARMGETMKLVNERMAATARNAVKALEGTRRLLEALGGPPTAEERLYARRATRALSRSLRNQPGGSGPKRRPHGRPR